MVKLQNILNVSITKAKIELPPLSDKPCLFILVPLPKYVYSTSCQNFPTEKTGRRNPETLAVCIVHTYNMADVLPEELPIQSLSERSEISQR